MFMNPIKALVNLYFAPFVGGIKFEGSDVLSTAESVIKDSQTAKQLKQTQFMAISGIAIVFGIGLTLFYGESIDWIRELDQSLWSDDYGLVWMFIPLLIMPVLGKRLHLQEQVLQARAQEQESEPKSVLRKLLSSGLRAGSASAINSLAILAVALVSTVVSMGVGSALPKVFPDDNSLFPLEFALILLSLPGLSIMNNFMACQLAATENIFQCLNLKALLQIWKSCDKLALRDAAASDCKYNLVLASLVTALGTRAGDWLGGSLPAEALSGIVWVVLISFVTRLGSHASIKYAVVFRHAASKCGRLQA